MADVQLIQILQTAAQAGHAELVQTRQEGTRAQDKDEQKGAHFVTGADHASQAAIFDVLAKQLPSETLIAEEQENSSDIPADCTVIDPLDGTTLFYNSQHVTEHTGRQSGVTLCTLRDGKPYAGVMHFMDGVIISAVRGHGCWLDGFQTGTRITEIPWHGQLDKTMLGTDVGRWTDFDVLGALTDTFYNVRSIMAGIYGARAVLLAETGAYYNTNIAKIWDGAAGILAVEEAGGYACKPDGTPLEWNHINLDWITAANKDLAMKVVEQTKDTWQSR